MALTQEEMDGLASMSPEDLAKLLVIIREAREMFRVGGAMPSSAFEDLVKSVPDKLVREIVHDLRGGRAEPGFFKAGPAPSPEARRGPQKDIPLGPPSGVEHCDRIADHFAALDRRDLERRFRGADDGKV